MSTDLKGRALHACPTPGLLDQRQPDEALIEVRWTCDECGQGWAGRVKRSHMGPWYEEWKRVRGFRWFRSHW